MEKEPLRDDSERLGQINNINKSQSTSHEHDPAMMEKINRQDYSQLFDTYHPVPERKLSTDPEHYIASHRCKALRRPNKFPCRRRVQLG